MSSRQRNLRKKPTLSFDDADDDGQQEEGPSIAPPAAAAALKKRASAQKLSTLSFGDEGAEAAAAKPKGKPKGSLRAPGTAPPPPTGDERAARVYTQVSAAGGLA